MSQTTDAIQRAEPYTLYRTREPLEIDGNLEKPAWRLTPRSPRFVDVISGHPALYDTRSAALWDDNGLYIGFWIEEPFVQATLTKRDDIIFLENDVEVFIDGGDTYYEFEINALNTVYEVFFIWKDAYERGGLFDTPEFDVFHPQTVTFGGNHDRSGKTFWRGSHQRGNRWAFPHWDFPGLKTAVKIQGPLNDLRQAGQGWTVELLFPWSGMTALANGRSLPPHEGDIWRIFFARYQQLSANGNSVGVGWGWDKIGSGDNHAPELWTPVRFSTTCIEDVTVNA